MNNKETPKQRFISQLADFLVTNQAGKGILMQFESQRGPDPRPKLALEWGLLRGTTPLSGYPTHKEAVEQLTKFLT